MKLSEMNNDVCIEKVIEITPYLGEIITVPPLKQ